MNNDFDFIDYLQSIMGNPKEEITKKYVQGLITKDEFIRRMKEVDKQGDSNRLH